ncbi:hypothetical protein HZS_4995 [Henneguya salminicola]|nr:hypothetical protein HZS_4995 [Henneguya salminicola]
MPNNNDVGSCNICLRPMCLCLCLDANKKRIFKLSSFPLNNILLDIHGLLVEFQLPISQFKYHMMLFLLLPGII